MALWAFDLGPKALNLRTQNPKSLTPMIFKSQFPPTQNSDESPEFTLVCSIAAILQLPYTSFRCLPLKETWQATTRDFMPTLGFRNPTWTLNLTYTT